MPLNLAQTAVSALKIGENALTAIYSGIIRVYPNEVTVSIDGANASSQSGTPGQPMNPLIYVVTPSNVSNYGWTDAQIAAATLTGLPAGFTATFSVSGGLGSQTGTWTITTTDGNFPNTDTAITVASLTSTISETTYGTVVINIIGTGSVGVVGGGNQSYTISGSNFVGLTVSGTVAGTSADAYTDVGTLLNPTYQTGSSGCSTTSGTAITFAWNNSAGSSRYQKQCNVSRIVPGTGTSTSSGTIFGESPGQSPSTARTPIMQINGPPWTTNPTDNIQCYLNVNYGTGSGSLEIDPRVKYWGYTDFTGGSYSSPYYFTQNSSPDQTQPTNRFYSYNPGTGSGSYTINIANNIGIAGGTWANNPTTRNASPAVSTSWNWT